MTTATTLAGIDVVIWAVTAGWVALYLLAAAAVWLVAAAAVGLLVGRLVRGRDRQVPTDDTSAASNPPSVWERR